MNYTIGDLAQRSGLTVRALHHYEKLGLLRPSGRTDAGYRLYGQADVQALHRILAYQQMGLALKDIGPLLGPGAPPLAELLARQIGIAQAELARQQNLLAMLQRVAERASAGGPDLTDHLLSLMALRRTYQRHFSEAELQKMLDAQNALGASGLARIKAEWATLLPALRLQMESGAGPRSAAVRTLAKRWIAISKGVPDDEEVQRKARAMFAQRPELLQGTGLTLELLDFLDQAVAAAKAARRARA
jgi:DNA-binding transcriptional MerR regulator